MIGTRRLQGLAIAWAWLAPASSIAVAEENPPPALTRGADAPAGVALLPRGQTAPASYSASTDAGGGWWKVPAGIAAALAAFGGVSVASRRYLPSGDGGPIRVVGRSALSGKHSACLLRVGDRVLIIGIGPQGAPSTLGEVTDPVELARLAPRREARPAVSPVVVPSRPSAGFDRRIGDDE